MANILNETALSLQQAAKKIPPGQSGRPVHASTLVRWIIRGVKGRRLEAIRVGARWYTSIEALERFATGPATSSPSVQSVAPEKVEQDLARFGL